MRRYSIYLVLVVTFLFSVQSVFSQTAEEFQALKKDIDVLKEELAGLRKDMQGTKKPVEPKPAAAPRAAVKDAIINIKGAPIKGNKNAKLVLLEFSDYQ